MNETYDFLRDLIAEVTEIEPSLIRPESHLLTDLAIDSLEFLDLVYEIEQRLAVTVPLDRWEAELRRGSTSSTDALRLSDLTRRIDALRPG